MVSDFSFLGARDYIQGGILLDFTLQALNRRHADEAGFRVRLFKINREVGRNVTLTEGSGPKDHAVAEMHYSAGSKALSACLIPTDRRIEKRIPDFKIPVMDLETDLQFSGTGRIESVETFKDVIEGIVEFNKQLHLLTLNAPARDPRIRIVFCGKFEAPRGGIRPGDLQMEIKRTGQRDYSGLRYTFSKVTYRLGPQVKQMDVCFSHEA